MQKTNSANFKFEKLFGYKTANDKIRQQDIISALKFDPTGNMLALGDRAGRVILFQMADNKKKGGSYEYYSQFQSHLPEFDSLRSMDIDETINMISWMKPQGKYRKILTTNSKTIKLWKIYEKSDKKLTKSAGKQLNMPKLQIVDELSFSASLQKNFPSQHCSGINSVTQSFNQEYLISSDDFQILLWSMQKSQHPFMIVDMKKKSKLEETEQLITCSKYHPKSDSIFVYGTNKGNLKLGDLRLSTSCDSALNFKTENTGKRNFFSDFISSCSDANFLANNRLLISRDFLTVKIWDLANTKKPVSNITIQDSLKSKLSELFQNECILDKFTIAGSYDSKTILTGNYSNTFHLIDVNDATNIQYELNYKKTTVTKQILPNKLTTMNKVDYDRKTLVGDFHPTKNTVVVSSLNCFFLYSL